MQELTDEIRLTFAESQSTQIPYIFQNFLDQSDY